MAQRNHFEEKDKLGNSTALSITTLDEAAADHGDNKEATAGLSSFGWSLTDLPGDMLLMINERLPSGKETARAASVNKCLYHHFQPQIGKKEAKDAAECVIFPTKENVEKLIQLLTACPALLLHPMTVTNRHGEVIRGTAYQIALHESDDELINDVIKPAFERLHNGLETMEAQHKAWFSDGWMEAEEKACASALSAIDNVFTAFENAASPNDVTELQQYPYTITINKQDVNTALDVFRKAVGALYEPKNEVITSGRDPIIRLLERVINGYEEKYNALGRYNTPRNNALMRKVYGYCQRFAPINFMQAFAQDLYYIVENKEKLIRTFKHRNWEDHFILPLDSDPLFRLGHEYFGQPGLRLAAGEWSEYLQNFFSIKNISSSTTLRYAI